MSGIRCRPPEATLTYALGWAELAGISEVVDITHLDCLGVPVFISRRPQSRSDVFTYGKGLTALDSEVGAYMEAIECHFAEPGHGAIVQRQGTAHDVAGAANAPDAILDFPPMLRKTVDMDAPLLLALAQDMESGAESWVPAELVWHPAPDVGQSLFGSSNSGLASGNSVLEASVHALAELLERDIWSFEFVRRAAVRVEEAGLPEEVRAIVERARREGLQLVIQTVPNEFGIPFFVAFLFAPRNRNRKFFNGGWGCHLDRSVALTRAVTEAAQSRLAFIHGGRPEPAWPRGILGCPSENESELVQRQIRELSAAASAIAFADIPTSVPESLTQSMERLLACLRQVTDKPVFRLVYTPREAPLQVVRLVVPMLEDFRESTARVGRRLKAAIEASSLATIVEN